MSKCPLFLDTLSTRIVIMATKKPGIPANRVETELKLIRELLEILRHKVDGIDLRGRATSGSMQMIRDQQSVMNDKLNEHGEKLDALLVDVNELKDDARANWDKITIVDEKHTKAIKEIRGHIGLPA